MKYRVSLMVLAWLVASAPTAQALNGMPYAYATPAVLDIVVGALGAVLAKETFQVEENGEMTSKDLWRVVGNAAVIGNDADGATLLVHQSVVSSGGKLFDAEKLASLRLRFGHTVSSLQADRKVRREEYRFAEGTRLEAHAHLPGLVLIHLPYALGEERIPFAVAGAASEVPAESTYLAFGHGNEFDEAERAETTLSDYEKFRSSGYLRWTVLQLSAGQAQAKLLQLAPLNLKSLKTLFQSIPVEPDAFVDGPCANDSGAALLVWGNRRANAEAGSLARPAVSLLGIGNSSSGTCRRVDAKVSPSATFLDLRHASF